MMSAYIVTRGEAAIGWVISAALAFCALYVGVAVLSSLIGHAMPDEDLLVAEAMVVVAFLPQVLLVLHRRHITVDALTRHLPAAVQRPLDVVTALCGLITYGALGWAAWFALDRAILNNSTYIGFLELAEWPARAMVLLGTAGGVLACLVDLVRPHEAARGMAAEEDRP